MFIPLGQPSGGPASAPPLPAKGEAKSVTQMHDHALMSDATAAPPGSPADSAWLSGFDSLTRRMRPALMRFFMRRVESTAIAEELVQELFLRLLRRADLFALENVDGYVFEAATNLARDRARRDAARGKGLHVELDAIQVSSDEPSAERVVEGRRRLERLMLAIEKLPPRTRAVLAMSRFEGMTYAQIARRLGVTVSAVEKHMVKALDGLKVLA